MGAQLDIEQAIRETTDRRAKHERVQRDAGRHKLTTWVAGDDRELFTSLAGLSRDGDLTDDFRAMVRDMVDMARFARSCERDFMKIKLPSPGR